MLCASGANSFHVSDSCIFANDPSEILRWLSPLEPRIRHQEVRNRRADIIGKRLLQTNEFQTWYDGAQHMGPNHQILFCCGDPAVGKTYFSSLVVDKLCDKAKEENIAVACFYVDFAAREEQSPTNMLGSLLRQIVGGLERIPEEICETFRDHKRVIGGKGLQEVEIVGMLQGVTSLQPTFICVDALDEWGDEHRRQVLASLRQILQKSPKTRIFLTGRRHIQEEIDKYLDRRATVLSLVPDKDDIIGYVRMRLSKDTSPHAMDSSLEDEIIKSIPGNIPETFLLIPLTMDAILGETTIYGRRQRLRAKNEGLNLRSVYGTTLQRIKEQGGEKARLGMAALMWISHSEQMLQLDELLHALAVETGSRDPDPKRIPAVETLLSSCLGLVLVDKQASAPLWIDKQASTPLLIHPTLQEHLCTCPDLFGPAHSIMAETCLTYLNFRTITCILHAQPTLSDSLPFLKYASLYWGDHANREASENVVSLALKLLSTIESHVSAKLLFADLKSAVQYTRPISNYAPLTGFTALHFTSIFGLPGIAAAFMDHSNYDLNKRDFLGITPLIWAAICGQEQVAKLLLERQTISPDKPDKYFRRTALSWAARSGHEGVVRLLLGRASAMPNGTDGWWGKTPRVVNKVRGRAYVNPNRRDKIGKTAISLAAEEGHEGVVKLLLGRGDIRPNRWGKKGQTPLQLAAEGGHEEAVQLLLGQKGINPNARSKAGQTPLALASFKGHEGVVKLLLEQKNVNPNKPDKDGRTPLWKAAAGGHTGIVKLLLGREDGNPDLSDKSGQTPLSEATKNRDGGVVGLILGRRDISTTPQVWW